MLSARLYKIDHFLNGVDGVLGVKSCTRRKRNCSQLLLLLLPLANHDEIRSKSSRIGCSGVQPEEPCDKDYDDHDADDVKNVHLQTPIEGWGE